MAERQLMGVRQAAKELGVAPSTISRGIGKHFKNYGTKAQPLVDLAEVRYARSNHLEPEKQAAAYMARGMELPLPEAAYDDSSDEEEPPAPGAGARGTSTEGELGRERVRMVRNQADRVEMDNLERQKELAPVADFADAGFELAQLLRRTQAARIRPLVAAIQAAKGDPSAIAQTIRDSDKACEERLAQAVEKLLDGKDIEDPEF
ncbi:hypothetical protein [Niveispirillum fermenti]|uniref:hypothetical protein n=1 Tax=Niveispirillum fermenti TaxID=1233113 RepID=UPI003A85FD85